MSRTRAVALILISLLFGSLYVSATCSPATSPAAKICSPVNGSTVTSPVHLVVGTADTHPISAIYTYVDNVVVNKTYAASADTSVSIAPGNHILRVQVWDDTGAILRDSVNITVSSGPPTVSVSVSPSNATLLVNTTQQFTATVSNATDTSVTWSVDGVAGGNAMTGTVSSAGLYTAPAAAGSHMVTATSVADTTKSGSADVSVVTQQSNCTPATSPAARICSPMNGSTVTSPVHLVVGTADTHPISAIYTYVDNVVVNKTFASSADTSVSIAAGNHILRVQVWDTTGAILRDSVSITVSSGAPTTTVTVSPSSASISAGGTQQFTATVSNNANTSVTWSVDSVAGGNATTGTISASGLYTAPTAAGSHTVTATSVADTTKSSSAAVTVTGPPTTTVTVSPSNATLAANGTQQFNATVTNNADTSVTWTVDSVAGGNSTTGTISASGLYTAPTAAGSHTVTATSVADTTKSSSAAVTVTGPPTTTVTVSPSNATLAANGTQQFNATVTNNADTSVTWTVDSVAGGNSTTGTISASGLYTAPNAAGSHTVTATSVADTTKSANAAVSVSAPPSSVTVSPKLKVITPDQTVQFTSNTVVNWSVDGVIGGDATVGTISNGGLYTPPQLAGTHQITATSTADSTKSAQATIYVSNYAGMFTYHNDNSHTGQNTAETVLTPANVKSSSFGKLFSRTVDGFVFAQPLYVQGVSVGGAKHNVVYVATEHCSVYAFDAEGQSSSPLWKRSFINSSAGINPVTGSEVNNFDLGPEAGITSTPVIDNSTGTLYVLVRTNENGTYFQRLHAISLSSGADKMTAAVVTATVNGTGVGGDGAGHITFNPLIQNQRPSLLLANNNVYIGWASHGDNGAYHGWIMSYDASTLQRTGALNLTPNGKDGGIWGAGAGPAADTNGNVFISTGNGTNDLTGSAVDFGDSYLKLNAGLTPIDFFSPFDEQRLNAGDLDLGSSGLVLLPDQGGTHPHLMVGSGKRGDLYVVDRDNLGRLHSGSNSNIIQYLPRALGVNTAGDQFFGIGSYWNGNMYFVGAFDHLKQFSVSNGVLSVSPTHTSAAALSSDRSAEPVVSANGGNDGIVWVIATDTYRSSTPAVLHAYDANDVSTELFNTTEAGSRDAPGKVVKFTSPTVANGRVYMGTRGELDVYGLLP